MIRRKLVSCVLGGLLTAGSVATWIGGCTGDGGLFASFTIGNTTFTIELDLSGLFRVQINTRVQNVVDVQPFAMAPTDTPATGVIRLRSSSVTILPPPNAKTSVSNQQVPISGTATLRVAIDAPGAVSPCGTGIELGTFEITVSNGVVTVVDPDLALSLNSTSLFLDNNLSMCLEMEADFDATIQIEGLDVTFGPSQDIPPRTGLFGTFELRNLDTQNVHILQPGEDFDVANQFTPGLFRNALFTTLSINDLVTFRAGRDGTVLDAATCPRVNQGDFFAIVEWDGFTLRCFQPVTVPDTNQACCVPADPGYESFPRVDGTFAPVNNCLDTDDELLFRTPDDCQYYNGVLQGPGTSCDTITCNEEFQACCVGAACTELLFDRCGELRGVPQGRFIHCTDHPCGELFPQIDACCLPDGMCREITADTCLLSGWVPQGTDSVCTPNPCPQPPGPPVLQACCLNDGSCQDADPVACVFARGKPQGPGTNCATTDCLGACCLPNGCCDPKNVGECVSLMGVYKGYDVACDTNLCPPGFDCYSVTNIPPPGVRFMTIQPGCSLDSGALLSVFPDGGNSPTVLAALADDIIPDTTWPTRQEAAEACCARLNNFEDQAGKFRATLSGVPYHIEQIIFDACGPFDPLGACCTSDGECTDASQEDCTALDSSSVLGPTKFLGIDTSCGTTTCPPTPTQWGLAETQINPDMADSTFKNTGRFEGSCVEWTQTANSLTLNQIDVDNGFENFNVVVTASFPTPPAILTPGETIVLNVDFVGTGTVVAFNPGIQFLYWRDNFQLGQYQYFPWNPSSPDFNSGASVAFDFTVPSIGSGGGEFTLTAFLLNCSECDVNWIYRAE